MLEVKSLEYILTGYLLKQYSTFLQTRLVTQFKFCGVEGFPHLQNKSLFFICEVFVYFGSFKKLAVLDSP